MASMANQVDMDDTLTEKEEYRATDDLGSGLATLSFRAGDKGDEQRITEAQNKKRVVETALT